MKRLYFAICLLLGVLALPASAYDVTLEGYVNETFAVVIDLDVSGGKITGGRYAYGRTLCDKGDEPESYLYLSKGPGATLTVSDLHGAKVESWRDVSYSAGRLAATIESGDKQYKLTAQTTGAPAPLSSPASKEGRLPAREDNSDTSSAGMEGTVGLRPADGTVSSADMEGTIGLRPADDVATDGDAAPSRWSVSIVLSNIGRLLSHDPSSRMMFHTGVFWGLFLVFLPLFGMVRRRYWQMVIFVVAFNFFFYYKTNGWAVLLLFITSVIDWVLSRVMVHTPDRKMKRLCVTVSIVCSLGILVFFKCAKFFLWSWNQMVEGNFQPQDIVVPMGISFYTFQTISYIVDVYRGKVKPTDTWLEYAFYLSFFPRLVAGPIARADQFLPQIRRSTHATLNEMYAGLWMIIIGILKKAVVADYLGQYNNLVFNDPGTYSGFETLMGVTGYVIQIYCDFSGYSDMAIGIALIMGFKIPVNFNFPYKSRNVSDFWRRWHISLSTWLRDYLYIPLGGNRKGAVRTYVNNFLTMLLGGLWHGVAWTFVVWGSLHGLALVIHKMWRQAVYGGRKDDGRNDSWPVKAVSWFLTMAVVTVTFIFFRSETVGGSLLLLKQIFCDFSLAYLPYFVKARPEWTVMMLVIIVAHSLPTRFWSRASEWFVKSAWWAKLVIFIVTVQLVIEFQSADVMPFIYGNF